MINRNKYSNKRWYQNRVILLIALLLVAAGSIFALERADYIDLFKQEPENVRVSETPSAGPETKGEPDEATAEQNQGTGGDKKPNGEAPTANLREPYGDFVSNHEPNLDGSPAPNTIQSICITTPGATCTISFTKGAKTISLPWAKTDREGAAYWTWKLQDAGVGEGAWTVKATAKLGAQSKSATDPIKLEVAP